MTTDGKEATRLITTLLQEIAAEEQMRLEALADGWVIHLRQGGRSTFVFGYDFAVNSASAHMIAKNKAVTAAILNSHHVPCVEHVATPKSQFRPWRESSSVLRAFLTSHQEDIVCKPTEGSGGRHVYRVRSDEELEIAASQILTDYDSVCGSPYLPIVAEHRVIIVNRYPELMYTKHLRTVTGDGIQTLRELIAAQAAGLESVAAYRSSELARVVALGESVLLDWRHNLAAGAIARPIGSQTHLARELAALALAAADAIGIYAAAVDVCELSDNLMVLEINAGIMMDRFGMQSPNNRRSAKAIYRKLLQAAFAADPCLKW
jgi:glutathione synthase/RimK-type ligase-like ATP-grasp enzyme